MVGRVLLNSSGLKVSKPGVEVIGAAQSGLIFSSDWASMSVFERNDIAFTWSYPASLIGTFSQTVMLGKVFPTVPFVMFFWRYAGGEVMAGYGSGFSITQDRFDGSPSSRWNAVGQTLTDRIVFSGSFSKKTSGVVDPVINIHYVVFDHNF